MSIDRRSFIRTISGQAVRSVGAAVALSAELRREVVDQLREEPMPRQPLPITAQGSHEDIGRTVESAIRATDIILGPWAHAPATPSHLTSTGRIEIIDQRALPEREVILEATSVGELVRWMRLGAIDGGLGLAQVSVQAVTMAAIRAGDAPRASTLAVVRGAARALIGARPDVPLIGGFLAVALGEEDVSDVPDPISETLRQRASDLTDELRREHVRLAAQGAGWMRDRFGSHLSLMLVGEFGPVATGTIGTTSAVLRAASELGMTIEVWVPDGEQSGRGAAFLASAVGDAGVTINRLADAGVGRLLAARRVECVLMGVSSAWSDGCLIAGSGSLAVALLAGETQVPLYGVASHSMVSQGPAVEPSRRARDFDAGFTPLELVPARLVSAVVSDLGLVTPTGVGGLR